MLSTVVIVLAAIAIGAVGAARAACEHIYTAQWLVDSSWSLVDSG
jgi:hypothetical protein